MELKEKQNTLKNALVKSFVEDPTPYKNTIKSINDDFKENKIGFEYDYDTFCVEFLEQSMESIETYDIFEKSDVTLFYQKFLQFNLYNIECLINKKIKNLGLDPKEYYK